MALFNYPIDAVRAAQDIVKALEQFNLASHQKGYPMIKVGVGINTGTLMLGIIGDGQRLEGSVIGDAVNTASRIESLTKQYNATILMSEATKVLLPPDLFELEIVGKVEVKGKAKPVRIWRIALE
jgi:adenylate cyclase